MNVLKAFMVISYWKSQIPPMMGNMKTYSPDVLFFFFFNIIQCRCLHKIQHKYTTVLLKLHNDCNSQNIIL